MPTDFSLIVAPATADNPRNTEGDIIELVDGTLLLAWSDFYDAGPADHAPARISAMVSDDGGHTWGERFTLQENVGGQNVMSASFVRLQSGDILLFFLQKNSDRDLQAMMRRSSDEGGTWSEPVMCTDGAGYYVVNNARIVQLTDGRLVLPASRHGDIRGEEATAVSQAWLSDDEGRTWVRSETEIRLPLRGAMEPGVVELRDGRILMIIRTQLNQIYRSYSADRGVTWTDAEPMGVGAPVAPSTIARIPSTGDLLLIWNDCFRTGPHAEPKRTPLTAAVSRDEGETWEHARDLETDPNLWYAYTSIDFVGGRVLLTYWEQQFQPELLLHLKFRSLPVEWFYG